MELEEQVGIVAGGIAGLATALALKKIGIRYVVLERSQTLRTTGVALTLSNDAWVALDTLCIAYKLTSIYTPFKKNITGLKAVHRTALLEALAQEFSVEAICFSSKLSSIETLNQGGSAVTSLVLGDATRTTTKVSYCGAC